MNRARAPPPHSRFDESRIPTVRHECEGRAGVLTRVNLREPETPRGGISLACGALEAIRHIDSLEVIH